MRKNASRCICYALRWRLYDDGTFTIVTMAALAGYQFNMKTGDEDANDGMLQRRVINEIFVEESIVTEFVRSMTHWNIEDVDLRCIAQGEGVSRCRQRSQKPRN